MNGNTIHPANTTTTSGGGGGPGLAAPLRSWSEFCELHAIATAQEVAAHYRSFALERPQQDVVPPENFSKHFTNLFQQHFCCEVGKDGIPLHQNTCSTTPESASSSTPVGPPIPSPSQAVIGCRLPNNNFSGAPDYREARRPSGGAAFFAVPPAKSDLLSREQEQALRCSVSSTLSGNPAVHRGAARGGSLLIHSQSSEEITGAERCHATERYSSDATGSNLEVTHFSVSQIRQSVSRIFKNWPLPIPPTPQDLSAINPTDSNSNPHSNADRVGGVSSVVEEETPLLSSSPVTSSCLNPDATPPNTHKSTGGPASKLFDRFRRLRIGSVRQKRVELSGCCKEGQLRYLLVDDNISDTPPHWQRCRLLVRRTKDSQGGGREGGERYQLELYDPQKASSPKLSARCSDILQVRRCNRLEMPDNLNTFVLKVSHYPGSLIFETDNDQQVSSWTTELRECISNRPVSVELGLLPSPAENSVPANSRGSPESGSPGSVTFALPEQMYHKTDHFLCSYPWFHGPISRVKAAHLVQNSGLEGHGVFLVRQSETRKGDYVLTFNYQGKAKHLRLSLTEWGQCRVQHLRFPSVMDMLSHFRLSPIPLECGSACDVTLSSFVVAGSRPTPQGQVSGVVLVPFSLHRWSSEPSLAHCSLARSPSLPPSLSSSSTVPTIASTTPNLGAASRPGQPPLPRSNLDTDAPTPIPALLRRSESVGRRPLLRHTNPHPPLFPQRDSDYELEPERGRKRAIDNQYMFL